MVLDYVWGEPTAHAMEELITARRDRSAPMTWVQIGSMGGLTCALPSAALRAARLQVVGSGIGSVPGREWLKELPKLVDAVSQGVFDIRARAVPLARVEEAWATGAGGDRIVLVP